MCCGSDGIYLYTSLQDRLFGVEGEWNLKRCKSQQCGLIWLDPMPINEDIYQAYESYYTHVDNVPSKHSIISKIISGYRAYEYGYLIDQTTLLHRILGKALSFFGFIKEHMDYPFIYFKDMPKGKLLELGSGNGDTLKLFKDWGWQAEGLDFDSKAVENASSKGLKVHQGNIFAQNFTSNTFDAIFSSHVMEHVPDPIGLMQEGLRVLKPNGCFVAVTPNASSRLHEKFKINWRGLEPPRHLQIFCPKSILYAAQQAGFKKIIITTGNYSAINIWLMSYKLSKEGAIQEQHSTYTRYFAHLVRFFLNVTHRFSLLSGEEIILIAYK